MVLENKSILKADYGFEVSIALRYLRAKRKQGFISLVGFFSVAGVSLGVMALVVVIAVMSGAEKDLKKRILGMEPHLVLTSDMGAVSNYDSLCKKIRTMENVAESLPNLSGRVMLRSKWGMNGTILRGLDLSSDRQVIKGLSSEQVKEYFLTDNPNKKLIILGKGVAKSLSVSEGDSIYALTTNWMISPMGLQPSMIELEIAGIFESGLYEYDNAIGYMKLNDLQSVLGIKKRVSGIAVYLKDIYRAVETGDKITDNLSGGFFVSTWMDRNKEIFSALKMEKTAMFVILTLIILVAAFNIASSLIMLVMEKTKEIAIMKTMGATKNRIKRIFVIQGTIIGLIGTFIGVASGVIICLILEKYQFIQLPDAYPFSTLPVDLQFMDVSIIAVSSVLICFLSTLYPAVQAAKLDPVEGIRYGK